MNVLGNLCPGHLENVIICKDPCQLWLVVEVEVLTVLLPWLCRSGAFQTVEEVIDGDIQCCEFELDGWWTHQLFVLCLILRDCTPLSIIKWSTSSLKTSSTRPSQSTFFRSFPTCPLQDRRVWDKLHCSFLSPFLLIINYGFQALHDKHCLILQEWGLLFYNGISMLFNYFKKVNKPFIPIRISSSSFRLSWNVVLLIHHTFFHLWDSLKWKVDYAHVA